MAQPVQSATSENPIGTDLWNEPLQTSKVIEDFIQEYESCKEDWKKLQDRAMGAFKKELEEYKEKTGDRKLLVQVTGRVKERHSLRRRLYQYCPQNGYKDTAEILGREVKHRSDDRTPRDFVGLRVAIYFPDQQQIVEKLTRIAFVEESDRHKPKGTFPQLNNEIYKKRFGGHDECHFRARLRPEDPEKNEQVGQFHNILFEIQLRSVIMDNYDTIHHDLEYKALEGDLSTQELRILDSIKGLASTGELLLEQFQEVRNQRAEAGKQLVETPDQVCHVLAALLSSDVYGVPDDKAPRVPKSHYMALAQLLWSTRLNTVDGLRVTLKKLDIEARLRAKEGYQQWVEKERKKYRKPELFDPSPVNKIVFIMDAILRRIPHDSRPGITKLQWVYILGLRIFISWTKMCTWLSRRL